MGGLWVCLDCLLPYIRSGPASRVLLFHLLLTFELLKEAKLFNPFAEPVVVSSSCSTDETVVADSDEETETIASCPTTATVHSEIAMNNENIEEVPATATVYTETAIKNGNREDVPTIATNREKLDEPELGNSDIIYSQVLVVRDMNLAPSVSSKASNSFVNFKSFRKTQTQSGNSFNNLIPFSKYPYK